MTEVYFLRNLVNDNRIPSTPEFDTIAEAFQYRAKTNRISEAYIDSRPVERTEDSK